MNPDGGAIVNTQFSGLGNVRILEKRDTGLDRDSSEKSPEVCRYGTPDVRLDARIATVVSECFSEVGNSRKTRKTEKSRADLGCQRSTHSRRSWRSPGARIAKPGLFRTFLTLLQLINRLRNQEERTRINN